MAWWPLIALARRLGCRPFLNPLRSRNLFCKRGRRRSQNLISQLTQNRAVIRRRESNYHSVTWGLRSSCIRQIERFFKLEKILMHSDIRTRCEGWVPRKKQRNKFTHSLGTNLLIRRLSWMTRGCLKRGKTIWGSIRRPSSSLLKIVRSSTSRDSEGKRFKKQHTSSKATY